MNYLDTTNTPVSRLETRCCDPSYVPDEFEAMFISELHKAEKLEITNLIQYAYQNARWTIKVGNYTFQFVNDIIVKVEGNWIE